MYVSGWGVSVNILNGMLLQDNHREFTFYSAAVAACGICRDERHQYCEADDIWFWAERRQWCDALGRLRPLSFFLSGDLEISSSTRWVGGQAVTIFMGNKKTELKVARWIVEQINSADDSNIAFAPPHFVDTSCCQSRFDGWRLVFGED